MSAPYDSDFTEVSLTKPVNLAQLAAEIKDATGTEVVLTTVGPADASQPISDTNAVQLYVQPAVDQAALQGLIDAHVPNPDWGVNPVMIAFKAVWAKLVNDPAAELSAQEVRDLAVGTAFRVLNQPMPPVAS